MDPSTAVAMKTPPAMPKLVHALLPALMCALALHGLALSYLQLQRNRATLPEALQSRDNTPELLQFSSQPAPVTNLDLLPLPQASILPPPRVQASAKPSVTNKKSQSRRGPNAVTQTVKKIRPGGNAGRVSPPSPPAIPKDLADAVEAFRHFKGPAEKPSEQRQDNPKTMSTLLPAQQESYEKLWAQARPQPTNIIAKLDHQLAEMSIEIRSLSLKQAQNRDLPIRHQQFVVLDNRIALFWLDGERLWILQSVNAPSSNPDSGSDIKG
jgi:hypothetical protein